MGKGEAGRRWVGGFHLFLPVAPGHLADTTKKNRTLVETMKLVATNEYSGKLRGIFERTAVTIHELEDVRQRVIVSRRLRGVACRTFPLLSHAGHDSGTGLTRPSCQHCPCTRNKRSGHPKRWWQTWKRPSFNTENSWRNSKVRRCLTVPSSVSPVTPPPFLSRPFSVSSPRLAALQIKNVMGEKLSAAEQALMDGRIKAENTDAKIMQLSYLMERKRVGDLKRVLNEYISSNLHYHLRAVEKFSALAASVAAVSADEEARGLQEVLDGANPGGLPATAAAEPAVVGGGASSAAGASSGFR